MTILLATAMAMKNNSSKNGQSEKEKTNKTCEKHV
jgi:hypothetical protein